MRIDNRPRARIVTGLVSLALGFVAVAPALLPRLDPLAPQTDYLQSFRGADFAQTDLMVRLDEGITLSADASSSSAVLTLALQDAGFISASEVLPGLYSVTASKAIDVLSVAARIDNIEGVAYAVPNGYREMMQNPNDEQYVAGQQWGISQIKAEAAWDITTGSRDIIIAVLDTGTATDHPDLSDKIVPGFDFYANDNNPNDDNGHGTLTAGIAAASSNNGTGVVGVSWGARIMPVKVLGGPRGAGEDEGVARGIRFAVDNGARIINASLGGGEDSPVIRDAVRYAADRNVLLVAASGNTPDGKPQFPAAYESVLAVGATGRNDTFTGFSSYGPYVDVTAPGVGILSTSWDNGTLAYGYFNGTSASCPFVSGLAALVWSVNPALTAEQVKWIIEDSSDDFGAPGFDENYGKGRVNAERAVKLAQQGPPPTRTATPVSQPTRTAAPTSTTAPAAGPGIQVDSRQVAPGALIAIIGAGFGPSENIDLELTLTDGTTRSIGSAQTDAQGAFRAEAALPTRLGAGDVTLTAIGATSTRRASARITVDPTRGAAGQSVVKGTVRAANVAGVVVRLKPSLGVVGPEITANVDANGAYVFEKLASGFYALTVTAPGSIQACRITMKGDRDRAAGKAGADLKESRRDRLKLALRENLKRRKSQARGRSDIDAASSESPGPSPNDAGGEKP